jgi:hypothetical protein
MSDHWPHVRKAIEGALHEAEKGQRGGYRVHCKSGERMAGDVAKHAKGPEKDHAKQIEGLFHKAHNQIDVKTGIPILQGALEIAKNYAKDGAPGPAT